MEREIRVRFIGDAKDMQRASQDAKKALDEVAKEAERSAKEMRDQGRASVEAAQGAAKAKDEFQKTGREARKMGEDAQQGARGLEKVTSETRKAEAETRQAASTFQRAGAEAKQAGSHFEKVGAVSQEMAGSSLKSLAARVGELATGFVTASASAAAFTKGLDYNSQMEQSEVAFKTLTGSAEQAKVIMEDLAKFAATTPFDLPQVVAGAKQLETYGLSYKNYLKDAGDLASAFNVNITEVTSAMGRIKAGDFGEAFERMRDFGISRKELEGEGLVFDKSGSYQGSVDAALTAVQKIIRHKFGGMMEEQSKTFSGQISNLTDSINSTLGTLTSGSFGSLKEVVQQMNGSFGPESQAKARQWGVIINDGLVLAIQGAQTLGGILFSAANGWLKLFQQAHAIGAFGSANTHRREGIEGAISGLTSLSTTDEMYGSVAQYRRFGTMSEAQAFANQSMGYQGYKMSPVIQDAMLANLKQFAQDNGYDTPKIMREARRMGLPPEVVNKLRKGLMDVESLYAQSMVDLSTDLSGQAVTDYKAKVGNFKKPPGGSDNPRGDAPKHTVTDLFAIGDVDYSSALDTLTAKLAKLTKGSDDYVKVKKQIVALENAHAAMMARSKDVGEQFGPYLPGMSPIHLPAPTYQTNGTIPGYDPAAAAGVHEFLRRQAERNAAVTNPIGFSGMTFDFDEQIRRAAQLPGAGELKGEIVKQQFVKGLQDAAPQMISTLSSLIQAGVKGGLSGGEIARALGGLGSLLGPQGAVLGIGAGIVGGYLDNRDRALGNYDRFARGEQVSRGDFVAGAKAKQTDFMLGLTSILNPDFADKVATGRASKDVKGFDLLTEASHKAAEALAGVAQSASAVNSRMDSRSLMAKLSGQPESIDLLKSVYNGGGNAGVANLLGNREAMQQVLGYYDFGVLQGNDQDQVNFARSIGRSDLSNDSGALKALFESVVMPAFSKAADLLGNAGMGGSISGAGTDSNLTFDAPQTRMITNNNSITVNTLAVTGDKASVRELARIIATEMSTLASQTV